MARKKRQEGDPKTTITCRETGEQVECFINDDGTPQFPMGWKKIGDEYISAKAAAECYCVRSSTLPVHRAIVLEKRGSRFVSPGWTDEACKAGWAELWKCLYASWRQCGQLANWVIREVARLEPAATLPGKGSKLDKLTIDEKVIYKLARQKFPDLDTASLVSIYRKAISKYKAERFDILRCARSLPSFRDNMPLPIEKADSPLEIDEEGYAVLRVRIHGTTFLLRMCKDRPEKEGRKGDYSRPMAKWRQAASEEIPRGAISIRQGGRDDKDILVGLAVSLPKETGPREATEDFVVSTAADALLVGMIHGRAEYVLNEDQLVRWGMIPLKSEVEKHTKFVQRTSQDRKAERRSHGRADYSECNTPEERKRVKRSHRQNRRNLQRAVEKRCAAHDRRVDDAIHKVARIVADHAKRRKVACVQYVDLLRTYMPKFPYFKLKTRIAEKLAMYGIGFIATEEKEEA